MAELMESVALGLFAEVAARIYPEGEEGTKEQMFALYKECMGVVVEAGKMRPRREFTPDRDGGDFKPRFPRNDRDGGDFKPRFPRGDRDGGSEGYAPRKKSFGDKPYGEKSYGDKSYGDKPRSTGGMYATREDRGGDRGGDRGRGPSRDEGGRPPFKKKF